MKKLIPAMLALLIVFCSCSTKKSFLRQRYTSFKHKKTTVVTEDRAYANKASKAAVIAPETVIVTSDEAVAESPAPVQSAEPAKTRPAGYTKAVVNRVILPVVEKGKELTSSSAKMPVTKITKVKSLNYEQKAEKRGLLWGVIDGILAIILLVAFVAIVVWLILVLV